MRLRAKKSCRGPLGCSDAHCTAHCHWKPHGQPHGRQSGLKSSLLAARVATPYCISTLRSLTGGYFRDCKIKTRFYAGILVSQEGSGTYGVGRMRIGRLMWHETPGPLARPSQATTSKISKPNRFAYPFRSRPRGVSKPLWLNSPEHQTSSYRDTANLGVGVRARGSRPCRNIIRVYIPRAPLSGPYSYTSLPLTLLYSLIHIVPVLAPGITRGVTSAKLTHTQSGSGVILRGNLF